MTKTLTTLLAAGLLIFVGCGESETPAVVEVPEVTPVAAKVVTAESLAAKYEEAFKAQDGEAVKALFCWDGVEGRMLQQQEQIAVMFFGEGMKEIVVDDVPPSMAKVLSGVERNDKLIVPNIEVTKALRITHRNNSVSWLPIGKKDNEWVISSSIETELVEEIE